MNWLLHIIFKPVAVIALASASMTLVTIGAAVILHGLFFDKE